MNTIAKSSTLYASYESPTDFLSYLRSKFDDEEANNFFTSFALTLQGKNDEFCVDLDEAYKWLGYAQKVKAVELLKKLKLREDEFLLSRTGEHKSPDKYLLKPAALKKLLLAARTKAAQRAAEYFIKIEEAIPEFCNRGGTAFTPPRASDWKALPISEYTARLTCKRPEEMIVSAGYNEDMSDPKAYFMRSGECTYPPGLIPEGAMVIDFGQTSDSRKRRADYERKTGAGEFLEHFPCPDPIRLERAIRRIADLEGRLVYGRRSDGTKTCEQAFVRDQLDYSGFAAKVYREQQKIIVEYCKLQAEREKRLTAEVELAKEKEKTQQLKEQVLISANEVAKAQAESEKERQKTIQLELQLEIRQDQSLKPTHQMTMNTEAVRSDNDVYGDFITETVEHSQAVNDQVVYNDLLERCKTWMSSHPVYKTLGVDSSEARKAMERFCGGAEYKSRRPPEDKKRDPRRCWNFVRWRKPVSETPFVDED